MKLFKRNKAPINIPDQAATRIANGILKSQHWFATSLQVLTKNWRQRQQWIFLYLICLVFGGMSIVSIVKPLKASETSKAIMPKSISVPKSIYKEDKAFIITEKEFQQVQEYKRKHPDLLQEMPGLFDSLSIIEQAYYSQKK